MPDTRHAPLMKVPDAALETARMKLDRARWAASKLARMNRETEKTRMLAGTIVVFRTRPQTGADQNVAIGLARRPLRTALQIGGREPGLRQHGQCRFNMAGFAVMRRLGKRDLAVAESEGIGGAGFHQRQCLDGLDG